MTVEVHYHTKFISVKHQGKMVSCYAVSETLQEQRPSTHTRSRLALTPSTQQSLPDFRQNVPSPRPARLIQCPP